MIQRTEAAAEAAEAAVAAAAAAAAAADEPAAKKLKAEMEFNMERHIRDGFSCQFEIYLGQASNF